MTEHEVCTYRDLRVRFGIPYSRTHIDRLEKRGKFPMSFKLGRGRGARRVWWVQKVVEWLQNAAAIQATSS